MDLNSVGINFNLVDGSAYRNSHQRGVRKSNKEAETEQIKPKDKNTSVANNGKGRVIDVSL